jgi:hypothetical protein
MPSEKAIYKQFDGYLINDKLVEKCGDYNSLRKNLTNFSLDEEPNRETCNESTHGPYPKILERFVRLSKSEILKIKQTEIKDMTITSAIEEMMTS